MAHPIPPRYSPAELIAELREAAEEIAPELNGIRPEETLEGESAQTLEEMLDALRRIAGGAPNPQEIARTALDAKAPLRPFGKARKGTGKVVSKITDKPAARAPERGLPEAPGKPPMKRPPQAPLKPAFGNPPPGKPSVNRTAPGKTASGKTSFGKPPGKPHKPVR